MKFSLSILALAISCGCAANAFTLAADAPALAADNSNRAAPSGNNSAANSTSKTATLTTVEVTAAAIDVSPSPVLNQTSINSKQLELQQATNLTDMLRYVPGVAVTDIGRFGSSGINIRGLESDQISMTVDGMALGESLDPASFATYDFFRVGRGGLDPAALKQVTVLKGADAITSGSGSLGGAVQFQTKDAADFLPQEGNSAYARLSAQYSGSNREWMQSMIVAGREQGLEALLVFTKRDGHQQQAYRKDDQSVGPARTSADPLNSSSDNLLAKLQYQLLPDHQIGLTADLQRSTTLLSNLSRQDATYLARFGDDQSERFRYGLQYEHSGATTAYDLLTLNYDHQNSLNKGLSTMLVTSPCAQNVTPCLRAEDRSFRQKAEQLRLSLDKELTGSAFNQQWLYGVSTQQKNVASDFVDRRYLGQSSTLTSTELDPALVPETQVNEYALFARDQIKFNDEQTTLVLGVRYDKLDYQPTTGPRYQDKTGTVQDVDFAALSWQSQLRYELTPGHTVSAQLGRGFRAPTVEDLYLQTATTTAVEAVSKQTVTVLSAIANPELKSERSLNLELAYQLETAQSQHKFALFRDQYTDLIESVQQVQNPGTRYQSCFRGVCTESMGTVYSQTQNVGEVEVHGAEVSGHWQSANAWQMHWSGAYQSGEKANGDPYLSISPWSAVLGVSHQLDALSLQLNSRFQQGKRRDDATVTQANGTVAPASTFLSNSAAVLDLSLQWDINPQLQLTAGVFNLLDKQYYRWERIRYINQSPGAVLGGVLGNGIERFSEPGRYARIGLAYTF
jgi:hemoglobin/transferrin/lactoferrin receptor protein